MASEPQGKARQGEKLRWLCMPRREMEGREEEGLRSEKHRLRPIARGQINPGAHCNGASMHLPVGTEASPHSRGVGW